MKAQSSLRSLLVGAVALVALPAVSYANTVSYQFGLDFSTGSVLGTPPFGTITLTDSGANLNVSVTLAANHTFAQTGSGDALDWNLASPTNLSISNLTAGFTFLNAANTPPGSSFNPLRHADGTGDWQYAIDCTVCSGGNAGNPSSFSFTIANLNLGSGFLPFALNGNNLLFATDLANQTRCAQDLPCTGDAAVPGPIVGAGLPGLLFACSGLVVLARRRRLAQVA